MRRARRVNTGSLLANRRSSRIEKTGEQLGLQQVKIKSILEFRTDPAGFASGTWSEQEKTSILGIHDAILSIILSLARPNLKITASQLPIGFSGLCHGWESLIRLRRHNRNRKVSYSFSWSSSACSSRKIHPGGSLV